jgi:hypothetical protein
MKKPAIRYFKKPWMSLSAVFCISLWQQNPAVKIKNKRVNKTILSFGFKDQTELRPAQKMKIKIHRKTELFFISSNKPPPFCKRASKANAAKNTGAQRGKKNVKGHNKNNPQHTRWGILLCKKLKNI